MRLSGTKTGAINQYRGLGNQLWDLAGNRPSLDIPFSETKSLIDTTTGTNLIDFSRASSGTYVGSDGLIKTATTNYLLQSEDFSTTWNILQGGQYLTTNQETAPNGTVTANKFTGSGSLALQGLQQVTSSTTTVFTFSVYAKYGTHQWIQLFGDGDGRPWANYDLVNGVVGSATGTVMSASIEPVGDGWYRCSLTRTVNNGSNTGARIYLVDSGTATRNATSATSNYVYLWGAQLEQSSTVGEYIPTTSTINSAPRFDHDPTTNESLGLLVEESRTNLLLRSEEFDDTSWTTSAQNVSVSSNQALAPDGTNTADQLTNTTTSQGFLQQNTTVPDATVLYTFSVFVKSNGAALARLATVDGASSGARLTFTFSTESLLVQNVGANGAEASGTFVKYPNGWYRLIVTGRTTAAGTLRLSQISCAKTAFGTANEDGTSGIYLWGAQLEEGSFPTSYIPTEGTTVTRAADVASISGSNFSSWYNASEGTVFAESTVQEFTSTVFPRIASLDRGDGSTNFIALVRSSGAYKHEYSVFAGTGQAVGLQPNVVLTPKSAARSACVYKTNDFIAAANGILSTADTSGSVPTSISALGIGMQGNGTLPYNGTIRRLCYWNQRLPNETLETITN